MKLSIRPIFVFKVFFSNNIRCFPSISVETEDAQDGDFSVLGWVCLVW